MSVTWKIVDDALTHDDLPAPLTGYIAEPYPAFIWRIQDGAFTKNGLPAPVLRGAFANCTLLETAHIPESVKRIGEFAFRNTALTSVTIASDCIYSPTSFPDGCEIHFYGEEDEDDE